MNGVTRLAGSPGQIKLPTELRADVIVHGFWKQGNTAVFDIIIFNLDADSYLRMTLEKYLAKAEKEKKELCLQACLESRRTFTPMVYSAERLPGAEALAS